MNEKRRSHRPRLGPATILTAAIAMAIAMTIAACAAPPTLGATQVRKTDGMAMVYVPAGEFPMGSPRGDPTAYDVESPQHTVYVDAFWLDKTEVTVGQYRRCVDAGTCEPPHENGSFTRDAYYTDPAYDDYPVIYVTWHQAAAYCEWAGARLPNEEEWEYAARGPEGLPRPWGDEFDETRVNHCDKNCQLPHADRSTDDGYADTAPVGSYPEGISWCGALDMLGNVWEWVDDWAGLYPGREESPASLLAPETFRLFRGGGWDTSPGHARAAFRNWFIPEKAHDSIGFRCARTP